MQDVSFEVSAGEALGIIGPNGAGKSTMLKLLTRILQPTRGRCEVRRPRRRADRSRRRLPSRSHRPRERLPAGRDHGHEARRDRAQVRRDRRLRRRRASSSTRRSSATRRGMNARLGFAIAAHLDPDVLIIDEVLSVGDVGFQEQCVDRMRELLAPRHRRSSSSRTTCRRFSSCAPARSSSTAARSSSTAPGRGRQRVPQGVPWTTAPPAARRPTQPMCDRRRAAAERPTASRRRCSRPASR